MFNHGEHSAATRGVQRTAYLQHRTLGTQMSNKFHRLELLVEITEKLETPVTLPIDELEHSSGVQRTLVREGSRGLLACVVSPACHCQYPVRAAKQMSVLSISKDGLVNYQHERLQYNEDIWECPEIYHQCDARAG